MSRTKLICLIIFLGLLCGCATFGELASEGLQITPAEISGSADAVSVLINDIIPEPYKIPSAIALGYIASLLRRMYKRKKGSLG